MRVTANTFPNSLVDQLNQLALRQNRLQNQATTGQRIQSPEDDPAAMRRVLDLQTESKSLDQYRNNMATLGDQANTSFVSIKALKRISDRASEITVLADGTKSPAELKVYSAQITQLIQEAVQLTNSRYRGDYLFGGTKSDQPPFVSTMNASGQVTAVTYQGNSSVAESEIAPGVTLSAETPGANTSGSGPHGLITDNRTGADLFNHLISLQNNLLAGDTAAISTTDHPQLALDEENFIIHLSTNGAVQARLEASATIATMRGDSLEAFVSKEADADLAQTLVRLNETQNAYKVALQSGGSILQLSLMDYLR
jgi:flagellar hook-associated protein 3 FlgL